MKYWCSWRGSLFSIILQLQKSHIKYNSISHLVIQSLTLAFTRKEKASCSVGLFKAVQCLLKKQSRASDEQQELRGLLSQGWWEQWVCAALERFGNFQHSQKKEAHSCSSSFCPRPQPRLISCKAPWLGVHTSCFVSYTNWANHSAEWLLIRAAHHSCLSISLGAITPYPALVW